MSTSVFPNDEHLSEVRFRLDMTLESVFVSTLLLADLTVPPQSLKSLGLHLVREVFGGADYKAQWGRFRWAKQGLNLPSARGMVRCR